MKQKTALACLLCILLLMVMIVFSLENRPHVFRDCRSCHSAPNPTAATARLLTGPVTQLCGGCHERKLSEGYNHPTDVRPVRAAIPPDMPLSRSREMTCVTCHDVHADYTTPDGMRSHFLRRHESGRAFCRICHSDADSFNGGHRSSLAEAHFRSQYIVTHPRQELDPMSKNCISCHDGNFASSVSIRAGVWRHGKDRMRHDEGSHPVGINYESVLFNRGSRTDLRPRSQVDPRIRFFDGKVGCGSCHDPYSSLPKQLVMSDLNSRLCFACHML